MRLQRGRGAEHPRQGLAPRAIVRGAGTGGGFGIRDVGNQYVVHARFHQRLHVSVRHLHGIARLGHGHFDSRGGNARIGHRGQHRRDPQFREVALPEGQAVEHGHGARQAHFESAAGSGGKRFEQLFAIGEQVVDHRLAAGGRRLAELVGALIAPIALLAFDDEFLHVAQIAAGLADEIARGQLELVQVVAAEARFGAGSLVPLARDQRHADRAHHAVVRAAR